MDICINTQTPLVQFAPLLPGTNHERAWPHELPLAELTEGTDYRFSPGGVTRMVYPLVKWLVERGRIRSAHWVSLNPTGPEITRLPGLTLHNLRLSAVRAGAYGKTKEAIWSAAHHLGSGEPSDDLFWSTEFSEYAFYNRQTAEYLRTLDRSEDFDLFYIHDFQQLQVGSMLDTLKPKLFRWHIPLERETIPESWRPALLHHLRAYDTVIVSSDRYREALAELGHTGRVVRLYPYVDPAEYGRPPPEEVAERCQKWGVGPDEPVVLVVARMDPAKGQDRAIRAFARVAAKRPKLKLVLVGNGSFSGSTAGLGLSKSARWRTELEQLALELGIADRVIFTGHVTQAELDAWYERCAFTLLPSIREGFGLVVVESWLHGRPAIVSRAAGVAELIRPGKNGLLIDPDDVDEIARAIERLLAGRLALRRRLVDATGPAVAACTLESAMQAESALLAESVEA